MPSEQWWAGKPRQWRRRCLAIVADRTGRRRCRNFAGCAHHSGRLAAKRTGEQLAIKERETAEERP